MSDISNQLIKNSYEYVLQSDLVNGVVYRIGGGVPYNPKFISGLTINTSFTFADGSEANGYVLTSDATGNATWKPISGATVGQSGLSGLSGISGLQGLSGSTGISGLVGNSGISGLVGNSGISGLVGNSGISGLSGNSGISGLIGTSGISGLVGNSGISGLVGNSGISGLEGNSGISGLVGNSGISGLSGESGISGLVGNSGISGLSGTSGISGLIGNSGISGLQGIIPSDATFSGITVLSAFTYQNNGESDGYVLTSNNDGLASWEPNYGFFGVTLDGNGSIVTTGIKGYFSIPYSGTIESYKIISPTSGNSQVDIIKSTSSIPLSANTITGGNYITLSSQTINTDSTLTSWTKQFSSSDIFGWNVISSNLSYINILIKVIKQ